MEYFSEETSWEDVKLPRENTKVVTVKNVNGMVHFNEHYDCWTRSCVVKEMSEIRRNASGETFKDLLLVWDNSGYQSLWVTANAIQVWDVNVGDIVDVTLDYHAKPLKNGKMLNEIFLRNICVIDDPALDSLQEAVFEFDDKLPY